MNVRFMTGLSVALGLLVLTACTTDERHPTTSSVDPDEGRYHEKSFSWTEASGPLAKGSALTAITSKETRFSSAEEMVAAVQAIEAHLKDKEFTDSLWKPVDYACDELDLAVWNMYGKVTVGDSLVFDEEILRSRCRLSEEIAAQYTAPIDSQPLAKSTGWKWWSESEVTDRQYPYKMIGRSWSGFDLWAYQSTGGETQFEKRRSRFGITAWYDTDASRIGVRIYLFDCGTEYSQRVCYFGKSSNSWYKDDDYVSKRDFSVGQIIVNSNKFPIVRPAKLRGSDGVLSMHSANHAGLQFRAYSSSGLNNAYIADLILPEYVTW